MTLGPGTRSQTVVKTLKEAKAQDLDPLLVLDPLTDFLDEHGLGRGLVEAEAIGDGHSNVTFRLRRGDATFVLRRPPRPPLPPSAHDVVREAKIQKGIAGRAPVPEILAICDDPGVIGAPFYVMEFVEGQVVGPTLPTQFALGANCRVFGDELVDALVAIHAIDYRDTTMGSASKPDEYLERQIYRFRKLWADGQTREIASIEDTSSWLLENLPTSRGPTIVHGDFRLGNAMFDLSNGEPRLKVVLDWEMATVGDPLADVGYMIAMWAESGDAETPMSVLSRASQRPGFSTRGDLLRRYERLTGRSLQGIFWYEILALWKAAIFLECSFRRFLAGMTEDLYFSTLDVGVPALADEIIRRRSAL